MLLICLRDWEFSIERVCDSGMLGIASILVTFLYFSGYLTHFKIFII
jgi:hypothetical protein